MARPRKSTTELKLRGQFRKDRHGERDALPQPEGEPKKPSYLKGEASKFWADIVPELVKLGYAKRVDTQLIVTACEAWAFYRQAAKLVAADIGDREARNAYSVYYNTLMQSLAKLGLSPADRLKFGGRVGNDEVKSKTESISEFARRRA